MSGPEPSERDFDRAVAEAARAVEKAEAARRAAEERARPRSRGPVLAVLLVGLVAVAVYDYVRLTAPPPTPPAEVAAEDLRASVAILVEEIEAFRAEAGRLPTAAELEAEGLLDEGVRYAVLSDSAYEITATDEVVTVRYRSDTPLDGWLRGEEGR